MRRRRGPVLPGDRPGVEQGVVLFTAAFLLSETVCGPVGVAFPALLGESVFV
ncbi:hypothetical protein [Streptomyces hirsutus]|uniref:hypothetical protein n=1 Tax=Streptomyces hirsutus TaxID=35620 RepID=UPI003667E7D0